LFERGCAAWTECGQNLDGFLKGVLSFLPLFQLLISLGHAQPDSSAFVGGGRLLQKSEIFLELFLNIKMRVKLSRSASTTSGLGRLGRGYEEGRTENGESKNITLSLSLNLRFARIQIACLPMIPPDFAMLPFALLYLCLK